MTDFDLAIRGDLQKTFASRTNAYISGLAGGSKVTADQTKMELRRDVMQSGLGKRIAFTMRADVHPKGGRSYEPSVLIYSKAPKIASGHADGATVRPQFSEFLPIPITGSPAENLRGRMGETKIEAFWRRFGNDSLRLTRTAKGQYLMVARLRRSEAGNLSKVKSLKPLKRRQGPRINKGEFVDVPVFTLIKSHKARRRLDSRKILAKAARRHPARLAFHIQQEMALSERDTAVRV